MAPLECSEVQGKESLGNSAEQPSDALKGKYTGDEVDSDTPR